MIFVDTGAWFAAFVPNDADHAAAAAWLETNTEVLVTTDYIVDELLTLLKMRGEYQRARNWPAFVARRNCAPGMGRPGGCAEGLGDISTVPG